MQLTDAAPENRKHTAKSELVSLAIVAAMILGGWFTLTTVLGTPTPFFVVSSGSMIPTLKVGDIIAIKNGGSIESLKVGDIIVYKYPSNMDRIIVHRVFKTVQNAEGIGVITKGDNNPTMDQDCGQVKNVFIPGTDVKAIASEKQCISLYPILENKVDGKAVLRIPLIGFIKLLLIDDPLQILGGCLQKNNCRLP